MFEKCLMGSVMCEEAIFIKVIKSTHLWKGLIAGVNRGSCWVLEGGAGLSGKFW